MARTSHLDLPLVAPAQAQKHVTINEAMVRLDATVQLSVASSTLATPPASAVDGQSYLVPAEATGAWTGSQGRIAVWSNVAWTLLKPRAGWRAWDESAAGYITFDGSGWTEDTVAVTPNGAGIRWRVVEFDHGITPGATNITAVAVPANAQVVGVTGRVISSIAGAGVTSWRVGVSESDNRYGSGLGIALNSVLLGVSGTPVTYYEATPLLLTAEGGAFAAGCIRLALHIIELVPPRLV